MRIAEGDAGDDDRDLRVACLAPPGTTGRSVGRIERDLADAVVTRAAGIDDLRALLADGGVDCVVVAHGPPAVDATEALTAVGDGRDRPPVVVVAADADVADAALDAGAADVVWCHRVSRTSDGRTDDGSTLGSRTDAGGTDGGRATDGAAPVRLTPRLDRVVERAVDRAMERDLCRGRDEALVVHDPASGDVVAVDERLRELLGRDPDAAGSPDLATIVAGGAEGDGTPETEARVRERVRAAAEGESRTVEWRERTGDGSDRRVEVELEARPVAGRDRVVGRVRVETVREAAEPGLEGSQERVESILERISDGFFAVDEAWEITYVNTRFEELVGRSADELVGENLWEAFPEAIEARFYEGYHEAMATQEPVTFEEYFAPLETWFSVRAHPDPDGLSVYFEDVTERRERERELTVKSRAIDEASIPLTLSDPSRPDNPLVYANDAFEELTGYGAAEARGRNCRFLQGPETEEATRARLRAAIDAEEPVTVEFRNYREDGTPFWNRLDVAPIYDDDGELLRFVGSQRDVTERRERERMRAGLLETTRELMTVESKRAVAETVVDAAADVLDCSVASVRRHDAATGELVPVATTEGTMDAVDRDGLPAIEAGTGLIGRTFEAGEPAFYRDLDAQSEYAYGEVEAALIFPLGEYGTLNIGARSAEALEGARRNAAELLATNAEAAFERARREQELREYRTLFETVRDMLYVLDSEGRLRFVSPALADRLGYDRSALVGEPATAFLTDAAVDEGERRVFDLLVTPDRASDRYEAELVTRDDERVPAEIELSLLPYDETFRGTVGAVRDISERRRRERELRVFRQAVDAAGVGLVMYDQSGTFTYLNDHYASLLGYDRSTLGSRRVWTVVPDLDPDGFAAYWSSFDDGETRERETVHRRRDGTTVPVETVTTAVTVDGTRYHIGTIHGVAGRRERRQQAAVLHRVLRHNLRNDLSIVIGLADMLAGDLSGTDAERAASIAASARGLVDTADTAQEIRRLLDRETVRKPVEVVSVIESRLAKLRTATGPDVALDVTTTLPDEQYVAADPLLADALDHLFENALEHHDGPVVSLDVTVAESPSRAGWVDVVVGDDGPGIPEEERAVLTAGEETALRHGSGLGLWVVYWIVTRYGGELRFADNEPQGSVVTVSLPTPDEPVGDDGGSEEP